MPQVQKEIEKTCNTKLSRIKNKNLMDVKRIKNELKNYRNKLKKQQNRTKNKQQIKKIGLKILAQS